MIRKITLLFLLCLGIQNIVLAQGRAPYDVQMNAPMQSQLVNAATANWADWYTRNHDAQSLLVDNGIRKVFTIPVVIHVIMPGSLAANPQGSTYDPSDATLSSMIDYLNQTFRATWGSYVDTNNGGTYVPIQFALAQRTGACGSTSGIERIDGNGIAGYTANGVANGSTTGASELLVKNLSRWPTDQYYNIWIVNKIDGKDGTGVGVFTAGYSYNPTAIGGGAPANKDGMILLATQASSGHTIIPQQMGFALGLLYTYWGSTSTACAPNVNCLTDGDQVCDTEPELNSNGACPTGTLNGCTGLIYGNVLHNFMDNSSCQDRFTAGQRARMIWGLYTYRSGLIGATGNLATGLNPASACTPSLSNPGNTQDAGVYEVKIQDNFNTASIGSVPYVYLDYQSGGYNTDGNLSYIDRTCRQEASLVAGNTYKFFVKAGPTTTGERVEVYIDYNNDGAFATPGELVYSHAGTVANELDSFLVTLPTSSSLNSLVTCIPIRMRVLSDAAASAVDPCGPYNVGQAEDYSIIIKGSGVTGSVTAVLPPFLDSSCVQDTLNFAAVPSPGAGGPITYSWSVNGTTNGITTDTFTTSTIADGASVSVKMYYTNQCGSADSTISNTIVVRRFDTLLPLCHIALTVGNNPSCPGYPMTFTATPIHGGNAPGYQWQLNGVNISGATADTFNSNSLAALDTLSCVMFSNSPCAVPATVTSNKVVIYHYVQTATITISQTPVNPICAGRNVTFIANAVAGANPTFQWYKQPYQGAYSPIFGATGFAYVATFNTGDNLAQIMCVMNAPDQCVINHLDTSNQLTLSVDSTYTPYIFDSIALGSNPGCLDSIIVFGGSAGDIGSFPAYTWLINGTPSATGLSAGNFTDTLSTLQMGDVVTLMVNQTDGGCYTQDTLLTPPITLTLVKTPDPPIVSLIGTLLSSNVNGNSFEWYYTTVNAFSYADQPIPGATSQTHHPAILGYYYCRVIDTNCQSPISNIIKVSLLDVNTYTTDNTKLFPNPSTGEVTVDWGVDNANTRINVYNAIGQGVMHEEVANATHRTLDLSRFANGNYFIEIRDQSGNVGTFRVTLSK